MRVTKLSANMPTLLTQVDVATIINKPPRWLERKRWEGGGPAFRYIGRTPLYDVTDVGKCMFLKSSTSFESVSLITNT